MRTSAAIISLTMASLMLASCLAVADSADADPHTGPVDVTVLDPQDQEMTTLLYDEFTLEYDTSASSAGTVYGITAGMELLTGYKIVIDPTKASGEGTDYTLKISATADQYASNIFAYSGLKIQVGSGSCTLEFQDGTASLQQIMNGADEVLFPAGEISAMTISVLSDYVVSDELRAAMADKEQSGAIRFTFVAIHDNEQKCVVEYSTSSEQTVAPAFVDTGSTLEGMLPDLQDESARLFLGWFYADGTQAQEADAVEQDIMLYAHWGYTITYHPYIGAATSERVIQEGTQYTFPSVTRSNYEFDGWFTQYSGGQQVTSSDTVSAESPKDVYGHWTYIPGPDPPTPPTPPGPTPDPSHEEHTYHNDDGSTTYEVIDRTKNPDGSSTVRTSETTVGTDPEGTEFENVVVVEETTYSSGRDYTEIRSESRDYTDGSSEYDYIELNQYRDGSTAGTEIHTSTQADGSYSTETTTKGTDAAGVYSYETVVEHYIVLTDGTASYRSTDSDGSVTVEAEASNSDGTVTTALEGDQIITTIDSTEVDGKRMLDATEQIDALDGVRQLDIQDGSTVYSEAFALAGESQVTLSIASEGGSLVLPAGVSSHIAGNVDYTTLTLVIEDGDDESLTPAQRQATGDKAVIVKLLDQDGNEVHELGGVAKIRFAYDIPQGESAEDMRVVYISDSGETEEMAYTYAQGMVEAEVPHLSVYSVVFGKDSAGSNGTLLIVLGAAVICITAGAAFVVYRRSRA